MSTAPNLFVGRRISVNGVEFTVDLIDSSGRYYCTQNTGHPALIGSVQLLSRAQVETAQAAFKLVADTIKGILASSAADRTAVETVIAQRLAMLKLKAARAKRRRMLTAKRVAAFRQRVGDVGLVRCEVKAHPDDLEDIRKLAARLAKRRSKAAK